MVVFFIKQIIKITDIIKKAKELSLKIDRNLKNVKNLQELELYFY